jgi:hypothetical protein
MTIASAALNDTWPERGHGPQHRYPELSADPVVSFVRNTPGK